MGGSSLVIFEKYNIPNLQLHIILSKASVLKDQFTKWSVFYFNAFIYLSKTYLNYF